MSENPITSTTAEADLAPLYGLPLKTLAAIRHRHLTEEAHWKKRGREIHYTASGLQALAEHLQAAAPPPPPADPLAIDGPAAPVVPLTARLVITKSRIRNPKIVLAKKEGAAPAEGEPAPPSEIVRVNVRNNAKLRPGMILEACTPLDVEHGYWEYRGKLPKKPRHTW